MNLYTKLPMRVICCIFLLWAHSVVAAPTLTYQGQLTGENGNVNASLEMVFMIYAQAQMGEPVWTERYDAVDVIDGTFNVVLGTQTPLADIAANDGLYLAITVGDGSEMTPRMKVGAALRAQWAAHAQDVLNEDIHPRTVSIGDVLVIDENGDWVGDLAGLRGPEGPQGQIGDTGPQGPIGDTGAQGPVGDTGAQGPVGDTGAQGPIGDTGAQGPIGDTGAQGPIGDTGAQGPIGDTGAQGPIGDTGAQGPIGDTGAQGPIGDTGAQGPIGDTGAQGPIGDTGAQGIEGIGVRDTAINANGELLITLTDGTILNAGSVSGFGLTTANPTSNGAPKQCTGAIEGETYYDKATHGMRVCDGEFWRASSGVCGNSIVEGGEECDGFDVDGQTCLSDCILGVSNCAVPCNESGASLNARIDLYQSETIGRGYDLATDGSFAVFGEDFASVDGLNNAGAVIVYQKRDGQWQKSQKLIADDKNVNDAFGYAVAISGNQIVVSAPNTDEGGQQAGALYVFEYDGETWSQSAKLLTDTQTDNYYFGYDVAIHDGVIVASNTSNTSITNHGQLFVFNKVNGQWAQTQAIQLPAGSRFTSQRQKLELSDGGLIATARHDGDWQLMLYQYVNGQFVQETTIPAIDFYSPIAMDGHLFVEGSGDGSSEARQARVYERVEGNWTLVQTIFPENNASTRFGNSVAIDGSLMLVGDFTELSNGQKSGAAYLYQRDDNGVFNFVRRLSLSAPLHEAYFGATVRLLGQTALVYQSGLTRTLHFYNEVQNANGTPLCTKESYCICKRGYGGADCATAL